MHWLSPKPSFPTEERVVSFFLIPFFASVYRRGLRQKSTIAVNSLQFHSLLAFLSLRRFLGMCGYRCIAARCAGASAGGTAAEATTFAKALAVAIDYNDRWSLGGWEVRGRAAALGRVRR
jgi:hypothetical protein